jgi:hypothetical protein
VDDGARVEKRLQQEAAFLGAISGVMSVSELIPIVPQDFDGGQNPLFKN